MTAIEKSDSVCTALAHTGEYRAVASSPTTVALTPDSMGPSTGALVALANTAVPQAQARDRAERCRRS
ncbi:hypothetical protein OKW50_008352 [Paraburkholderia youngii]